MSSDANKHLVITLHGIRTYGRWQQRLEEILREAKQQSQAAQTEFEHFSYGVFDLFKFLIPFARNSAVKKFRQNFQGLLEGRRYDSIDIVAHSFGTYLAIRALESPELPKHIRVRKAILCGCVLPPDENLSHLVGPSRRIDQIINDCGTKDGVLLATLAVWGVGMAGRLGLHGFQGSSLENRFFRFGHSGYFEGEEGDRNAFMKRWWVPALLTEEPVATHDDRPEKPTLIDRVWRTLGENGAFVTFGIYAIFLTAFIGSLAFLWLQADHQRKIALTNESRALAALSSIALKNERYQDSAKLALASWPRKDAVFDRPQLKAVLDNLSAAMSVPEVFLSREMHHGKSVVNAFFTNDEGRILSRSLDNYYLESGPTMWLWDAATGQQIGPLQHGDDQAFGAVFSKDEQRILSWGGNTVRLWNADSGQPIGPPFKHGEEAVGGAAFSSDEKRILSWGISSNWPRSGTVRLWDVATGQQIGLPMKPDVLYFSPKGAGAMLSTDGQRILSWGNAQFDENSEIEGSMWLWDAATGKQIGPPMRHGSTEYIISAVLTKDNKRILSRTEKDDSGYAQGGTEWLWDATTGRSIGQLQHRRDVDGKVFTYEVNGAVFTKNEQRILSWSRHLTDVRLWDTATARQIGPIMAQSGDDLRLLKKEQRIVAMCWGRDRPTCWGIGWPIGNLLEIACAGLGTQNLEDVSERYAISLSEPICIEGKEPAMPNWSLIER